MAAASRDAVLPHWAPHSRRAKRILQRTKWEKKEKRKEISALSLLVTSELKREFQWRCALEQQFFLYSLQKLVLVYGENTGLWTRLSVSSAHGSGTRPPHTCTQQHSSDSEVKQAHGCVASLITAVLQHNLHQRGRDVLYLCSSQS